MTSRVTATTGRGRQLVLLARTRARDSYPAGGYPPRRGDQGAGACGSCESAARDRAPSEYLPLRWCRPRDPRSALAGEPGHRTSSIAHQQRHVHHVPQHRVLRSVVVVRTTNGRRGRGHPSRRDVTDAGGAAARGRPSAPPVDGSVQPGHVLHELHSPVERARRDQLQIQVGPVRIDGVAARLPLVVAIG